MAAIDQTSDQTKNVCWGRGDDDPKGFTIKSGGVALDVSLETFRMTVNSEKNPLTTANEQFSMTHTFLTDGTDGKIVFTPATGNTDIPPGKYFADIERVTPNVKTLIKLNIEIVQDISK